MKFVRSKPGDGGELPLTTLIDVVFLLLIFFMLTASTMLESELASTLRSDEQGGGSALDLQPQVITIEMSGEQPLFRLGQRVFADKKSLTDVLVALPKEAGVFIKVPGQVPMHAPAKALQAAKDAGFTKVTYVPVQ